MIKWVNFNSTEWKINTSCTSLKRSWYIDQALQKPKIHVINDTRKTKCRKNFGNMGLIDKYIDNIEMIFDLTKLYYPAKNKSYLNFFYAFPISVISTLSILQSHFPLTVKFQWIQDGFSTRKGISLWVGFYASPRVSKNIPSVTFVEELPYTWTRQANQLNLHNSNYLCSGLSCISRNTRV